MRRNEWMWVFGAWCISSVAGAQDVRPINYPGTYVDRPLTLRGGDVRIDGRYQFAASRGVDVRTSTIGFGAAVGITDRIELAVTHTRDGSYDLFDATGFGLDVGRDRGNFGDRVDNVYVAARFGLVDREAIALGLEGGVQVPTHADQDVKLVVGVPLRAHLGDHFNLDLAPELVVRFSHDSMDDDRDAHLDTNVPVAASIQLGSKAWLGVNSGIYWPEFDVDLLYVPVLMEFGYTIKRGYVPVVDIEVQGGWPRLFVPAADDSVRQDTWVTRLNLRLFLAH